MHALHFSEKYKPEGHLEQWKTPGETQESITSGLVSDNRKLDPYWNLPSVALHF